MWPASPIKPECPFWARGVTLARVKDSALTFSTDIADKEEALRAFRQESEAGAVFFVAWTGQYKTHLFTVAQEDADRLLSERQAVLEAREAKQVALQAERQAKREERERQAEEKRQAKRAK